LARHELHVTCLCTLRLIFGPCVCSPTRISIWRGACNLANHPHTKKVHISLSIAEEPPRRPALAPSWHLLVSDGNSSPWQHTIFGGHHRLAVLSLVAGFLCSVGPSPRLRPASSHPLRLRCRLSLLLLTRSDAFSSVQSRQTQSVD